MIRIKWSIVIIMLLFSVTASAEYYKYRDQNGNIVFTDDITRVPRDQQSTIQKYQEYQRGSGAARQEAPKEDVQQPSTEAAQEETPATGSPDTKTAEGDLENEKRNLDKRKQELDSEYQSILKDKEALNRNKVFRNKEAAAAYNSNVVDLNLRIDSYEKKKEAFNADIDGYNNRVKKEIEGLIGKKPEKK